ncbi:RagB/SusD family nutrient uptake outer membrane protein [Dysgonomonas sp. 520]|uniref:RagB/SusD family nutrient uptake outer membrane protein n=1 Tax=Dysgonomonas sp. 520 TaxID=2302931 RepID=UPI0013CFE8C1|nr:RagB/SusD family nutrient uptake outer membrane protein [Dysgonomonas sp. 520]NDW09546.1 hypothetical protein [Dysgonomonas sp. 520]
MKTIKLLITLLPILFLFACEDNDKDKDPDNGAAKQEVDKVASELSSNNQTRLFSAALSALNLNDTKSEEFTIFALENEAITYLKSSKENSPIISQNTIKRHIVKGAFTLEKLKEKKQIESINGDLLNITVNSSGLVFINGVKLGTSTQISKSIVFIINKIIPEKISGTSNITFKVFECNTNWSAENPEAGTPSENATIKVFDEKGNLYQTLQTNSDGTATMFYDEKKSYTYEVEKGDYKNLYNHWLIKGVFTSQAQLDYYSHIPYYSQAIQDLKKLGGLILADMNGDGIINNEDTVETAFLNTENDIEEVYLYPNGSDLSPIEEEVTDEVINALTVEYTQSYNFFLNLDNDFYTQEQRQTLTPNSYQTYQFWAKAYYTIGVANRLLSTTSTIQPEHKAQSMKFRALSYLQLVSMFGDVPLVTTPLAVDETVRITRSSAQEVLQYSLSELEQANDLIPTDQKDELSLNIAIIYLQQKQFDKANNHLTSIIDRGLKWNTDDNSNRIFLSTYLLLSETYLETGRLADAILTLGKVYEVQNRVSPITSSTTADELRTLIRTKTPQYKIGLNTINNSRWGIAQSWGKYALMPIPQREIDTTGGSITQNPGW